MNRPSNFYARFSVYLAISTFSFKKFVNDKCTHNFVHPIPNWIFFGRSRVKDVKCIAAIRCKIDLAAVGGNCALFGVCCLEAKSDVLDVT